MFFRRILSALLIILLFSLTACVGIGEKSDIKNNLTEICDWMENDLLQACLCEFSYYNLKGTTTDGKEFNYDEFLNKYDTLYQTFVKHKNFVDSLDGEYYSSVKSMWQNINTEVDKINSQIKQREIGGKINPDFEVESLYKYINELGVIIGKL